MPDTRTFDEGDLDPVARAVREALGETVRPVTPGKPSATTPQRRPGADASATLASFTFRSVPGAKPPASPAGDEQV